MQQQELVAGDTLNFATSVASFPASAGWTLKYRLAPREATHSAIDLVSVPDGDDHRVQVTAVVTAGWSADVYTWSSWVEKASERYTIDSGLLTILADPRAVPAGHDGRTLAQKALDDCKAALAAWNPTRRRYRVGEREMEFASSLEIIRQINYWSAEVNREDIRAGRRSSRSGRILSRL